MVCCVAIVLVVLCIVELSSVYVRVCGDQVFSNIFYDCVVTSCQCQLYKVVHQDLLSDSCGCIYSCILLFYYCGSGHV